MTVIGLDAFDVALARDFVAAGELPVLGGLLRDATVAPIDNPEGIYGGTLWVSFATGLGPAGHARFARQQAPAGAYLERSIMPDDTPDRYFW